MTTGDPKYDIQIGPTIDCKYLKKNTPSETELGK